MSEVNGKQPHVALGEVCNILSGYGFPEALQGNIDSDLPFFKVGDISEAWKRGETFLNRANHYISFEEARTIRAKPLPAQTTVFAKIGAAIALNRRAILSRPSLVDNNVMGLHPISNDLDFKFLYHFACTLKLDERSRATTVPSIRKSDVEQIQIPLPTLEEQRRIVAEIEKQFTRLDAGIAALKRTQANLKRYRAAVLKAACEGKLVPTEAALARAEGRSYESGEALLQRILAERRAKWNGRRKYKEPVAPNVAGLAELAEGWCWTRAEQLGFVVGGLTKNPKRAKLKNQLPYLRIANVYANELRLNEIEQIGVETAELEKLLLQKDDLLIVEGNGSKDQIGRLAKWDGSIEPCVHQNHLIKIRLITTEIANWELYWLLSPNGRTHIEQVAASTSGLYTLSVNKIGDLPIAFPPLAEQQRIVAEVERRLSVIEEMEAAVAANLRRAARLRQAVLQRAFAGKL